jgi:hypothetical protein
MKNTARIVFLSRAVMPLLPLLPLVLTAAACEGPPPDGAAEETAAVDVSPLQLAGAITPDPNTVHIKAVNASGGSGCPQGTVTSTIAADGLSLTVLFDQYVASMGPGVPITRSRVQCTLNIGISVPQGQAFTITQIDTRGFLDIPKGVTATRLANYRFQGNDLANPTQAPGRTDFVGPARRTYQTSDSFELPTLVFSKCGLDANINVDTSVRLAGDRNQPSLIAVGSVQGSFVQQYHLAWKRC